MPLATGTKLDGYELLGLLGAGGMGEVYRARDSALRREVAIKVLPAFVTQDPDRLRRFEQEAQAAAALNHPNILAVHRFGVFEDAPYLVAELLEGSTLRDVLRHGALPPRKAIDYGVQIAHGLAAAHDKGIVHRDLKPENLFVTKDGRVKILDFGLAKLMQRQPDADGSEPTQTVGTDPGVVMGTVGYMSPEQVRGKTVDHRTDIFSFGAILYEMLSGKRAFQRSTTAETMTAILHDDPPSISQVVQTAPAGLQRVVHRCLEKNPEQRFQSASDLAFALEALSDSGSVPTVGVDGRRTSSRWIWAACAAVAAVLIGALVVWWRMEPAVPVVESIAQLTDDGKTKGFMVTDGMRIYYQDPSAFGIGQVAAAGGATAPVEMKFPRVSLGGITNDGSALLVATPADVVRGYAPIWFVPLPAGEPRRFGNFVVSQADIFPDGRVLFEIFARKRDGEATGQVEWFVAEKDGSNPRKLITLPGNLGSASVSPDSEEVVIVQEQPGDRRLVGISADGTGQREIRKLTADEREFRWTPDGKYLVYRSGTGLQTDIWLLPMKTGLFRRTGEPIRMTNGPLSYSFPCPSRDGKQIFAVGTKRRGELVRYDMKSKQFVPFLGGISATDTTFSRDGEWVAYSSYPDHTIWRSRIDGSERTQLTFAPMNAQFPFISPDGTKVSFDDDKGTLYVVDANGGTPKKIAEETRWASWSPDGNYILDNVAPPLPRSQITDMRTGKSSAVPQNRMGGAFWFTQDILIGPDNRYSSIVTHNLKTQQLTRLTPDMPGTIEHWIMSPDGKYMYFTTGGAEPMAMRVRIADHQIETIASLKDLHRVVNFGNTQINVAPDGSPVFTRDTGYQEIYALNMRWP